MSAPISAITRSCSRLWSARAAMSSRSSRRRRPRRCCAARSRSTASSEFTTVIEAAAGAARRRTRCSRAAEREPKNAQLVASPDGRRQRRRHGAPGREIVDRRARSPIGAASTSSRSTPRAPRKPSSPARWRRLRRDRPILVLEFNAARARDPGALLATLGAIYGGPRCLDLHGNAWLETTPEPGCLRERFATDWLLVFGLRLISAAEPISRSSSRRFCPR